MSITNKPNRHFSVTKLALPYVDNVRTISITLLLNVLLTWCFRLHQYEVRDIVIDAVICAWLTTVINVLIVWRCIRKARSAGAIPNEVPVNKAMMLLPKNRLGLIGVLGTFFTVLCVGINYTVFTWYSFESWTYEQFLLFKLVYSLILSERIVSLCILRLVQPDCEKPKVDPITVIAQPIKNPLPSISGIRELFSTISVNLILQLYSNPYIDKYTIDGDRSIIMEGTIASAVTCFIVIGIITKTLDMARVNGEFNVPQNRFLTLLPRNRWLFALICALITAPITGLLFISLFKFYGFTSWTFYEFLWIKTVYLLVLGKILVAIALRRFTQPDIIG